jgi:hypothetical protein
MSDSCTAAAPFVEAMARKFQAEVTLLHILEMPPGYVTDWYGYMALVDTNAIRNARKNEFDTFLKDKFPELTVRREMLEGDPAQLISTYAASGLATRSSNSPSTSAFVRTPSPS